MSKSIKKTWLSKSIIPVLSLFALMATVIGGFQYFNSNLSESGKTAKAATTYTCAGVGGTLSGTNCILDRTVGYNNNTGAAIPNYSVTDQPYTTANGWSLVSGSIYNNYVDGLRVKLSDNAYNAAGTLQTSPSAGFFGQSTDARSGLLEMGKQKYLNTIMSFGGVGSFDDSVLASDTRWSIPAGAGGYENDQIRISVTNTPGGGGLAFSQSSMVGQRYLGTSYQENSNLPGMSDGELVTNNTWPVTTPFMSNWLNDQMYYYPNNDFTAVPVASFGASRNTDMLGQRYLKQVECLDGPGQFSDSFLVSYNGQLGSWTNVPSYQNDRMQPISFNDPSPAGIGNAINSQLSSAGWSCQDLEPGQNIIDTLDTSRGAGNIQYQIVHAAAVATSDLTEADIPNLNVNCGSPSAVNDTTSCSFILPVNKTLPPDLKFSIGVAPINQITGSAQLCGLTVGGPANQIQCNFVPTGNSVGNKKVYGNLGIGNASTKTDTGKTVDITGVNFGAIDWEFTPPQGGISPLFRSNDNVTVTVKNFRTIFDPVPTTTTRYKCNLAYRALNDRNSTSSTWNFINQTANDYNPTTGCTFNITKAMRGSNLNYSLWLNITDPNTISTGSSEYNFYNEYIYRFQGAGTASGGNISTSTITASAVQANYGADIPAITLTGATIPNQTSASITIPGCSTAIDGFVNNNIFTAPSTLGTQVAGVNRNIRSCANLGLSSATLNILGYSATQVILTMLPFGRVNPVSMTYTNGDNFVQFSSGGGIKITKQGSSTPLNTTSNKAAPSDTVQISVTGLTDFQNGQPLSSGSCYIDLATSTNGQTSQALFETNNTQNNITQANIVNGSCSITGKIGYQQNYQLGQFKPRLIVAGPKGQLFGLGDLFSIEQVFLL